MNKQKFNVIFNRTLGRFVVVSELARSTDKSSNSSPVCSKSAVGFSAVFAQLKPVSFSLFCALGFVSFSSLFAPVFADTLIIQADKSAPKNQQPIILSTANGLPQVNIQTPNAKGLSHNKYSQFDVAKKGAILNNSRTGTATQLADQVTANPYLARGEAKVILNEVNSSNPSVMKGYVEVAGGKADVIIANPSGLHCEGCGVINSGRVTLSTGKLEIKNGQVDNFKVDGGKVVVSGRGLDNSRVDYTEILAREAEINAGIWSAKKATIITGKNTVKRTEPPHAASEDNHLQIIHTNQPTSGEAQPQFALDVAELGGMYAGKIHLISTENGVGVRNAGHIGASSSSVVIDVNGKVVNKNSIQAQQSVEIRAKDRVENIQSGKILAHKADINIKSDKAVEQSGIIGAKGKVSVESDSLTQTKTAEMQGGEVRLQMKTELINRGLISSKNENGEAKTVLRANRIENVGTGRIYGDMVALGAQEVVNHDEQNSQNNVVSSAIVAARKRLDLGVQRLINQNHHYSGNTKNATALFSGGELYIGGKLNAQDQVEGQAEAINNRSALIESLGKMQLSAALINNTNDFFATELKVVSERHVNWHYIVPQGVAESELRFDRSLLKLWNKSRGRNGFEVRPMPALVTKPNNGDVQSHYLPQVNQCDHGGSAANCEFSVHSYYFPSDPAWAHFAIKPSIRDNVAEILQRAKVPVAPVEPMKPQAPSNANAAAQRDYEKLLAEYERYKAIYDAAYQTYLAEKKEFDETVLPVYRQWVKDNENAFAQLSQKVQQHNRNLASQQGNRFSDYWVTKVNKETLKEDVVTQSQAGEILAGGDLTINTERLVNDKSRILSGGELLLNGNLEMRQASGRQIIETYGDKHYSFLKQRRTRKANTKHTYKRVNEQHYSGMLTDRRKTIILPVAQMFEQYAFDEGSLVVKPAGEQLVLPSSSLYKLNPQADSHVLIETDPAFTDYRKWLSSDYMYNALRYEPNNVHKRLGDGYYEQRLVREQLNQLTGKVFSGSTEAFEAQYKTLMDNGLTFAQRFNLRPGVSLTAAQVAQLTSDIVWFETQTIKLPNGTTQPVLVPKVYAKVKRGDLSPTGALLQGEKLNIVAEEIANQGRILGRDIAVLNAKNITNEGDIYGRQVDIEVKNNLINQGAVEAERDLSVTAGGDVINQSTTQTSEIKSANYHRKETALDRKALLHVKNGDGKLSVVANNFRNIGAEVSHGGEGDILLSVKGDMDFTALQTEVNEQHGFGDHYRREKVQDIEISHIQGKGNIHLRGHNLNSEAALVENDKKLTALFDNNVVLASAKTGLDFEEYHHVKTNAGTSKKTQTTLDKKRTENHQGSVFSAGEIEVKTGNKLLVDGSDVVAEGELTLSAKNAVEIKATLNKTYQENFSKTTKSGLSGTGGIGFSIGSQKTTTEADNTRYSAQASQVGSLKGDVNIQAQDYKQTGSYVSALEKDVNIQAEKVEIGATQQDYDSHFKQTTEQKGLTIAITAPAISAIQAAQKAISSMNTVGASRNNRVNAMAAANAAWDGLRAAESIKSGIDATQALANGDIQNAGVGVSITYSQQKSEQTQTTEGSTAATSKVNAGGKVNINAEGSEKSHLHINGADISGKQGTHLASSGDVTLSAAEQTHQERSQNKSSGFNAGAAITYGTNGFAMGITAGGNYGKGYGNGDDATYAYSHIGGKQSETTITSGKTTALSGTQVYGNHVKIDTTDLTIRSLQETATYKGKQKQVSGQLTVGAGAAVAGSYNQSKVNSDYASVIEQSGIYAGKDGFDINARGNISSFGGAIVSVAEKEKNTLSAQDFYFSDIQNHSKAKASAMGLSGGFSIGKDQRTKKDKELDKIYRQGREGETFEKANPNQANASPVKFGLGENDVHSADTYAIAKIGLANLLSNSSQTENYQSTTYAVVSTGNFNISSERGQQQIEQVKKSTMGEVNALEKVDGKHLQNEVERDTNTIQKFLNNVASLTDESYRTMFIADHRLFTYKVNEKGEPIEDPKLLEQIEEESKEKGLEYGTYLKEQKAKGRNIYQLREVSDQERANLKQMTYMDPLTGKSEIRYVVAFNGIFNNENDAAKLAVQNYVAGKNQDTGNIDKRQYENLYFVHHPKANNPISELLVAGYQKMLEGSFGNKIFGMDNSALQAVELMKAYGKDNLYLGGHSRGTLTLSNALTALDTEENRKNKILSGTLIKMVGPAADVTRADNRLSGLQTGGTRTSSEGSIRIENHVSDPVGSMPILLGGNPSTMDDNRKGHWLGRRLLDMFSDERSSVHNCYGLGNGQCLEDGYRPDKNDLKMNKERAIYDLNKK